jgi:hypothetical protein
LIILKIKGGLQAECIAGIGGWTADVHDGLLGDGVSVFVQVGCGADDVTGNLTFADCEAWEDAELDGCCGGVAGRIAGVCAGSFCGTTDKYRQAGTKVRPLWFLYQEIAKIRHR